MFRRGISTMFVSLSRSIFLWVKTPTLSNCLKAENGELVRSTLRTSGKNGNRPMCRPSWIIHPWGIGAKWRSRWAREQGRSEGTEVGAQEQRNSRSRETATLRTASPSIVLERGGRGEGEIEVTLLAVACERQTFLLVYRRRERPSAGMSETSAVCRLC